MEIQQLKGFIAVAQTGSFSKAALKTLRTQPAISLQINALEQELGVKLFERLGHKQIRLTEKGRLLFEMVSPLLLDIETLTARFNDACGKETKGPVKIATHGSVMVHLLPDVIKAFRENFSACQLSIVHRSREEIVTMVTDGEVDLGITSLKTVPEKLNYQVFARFRRFLITPKKHPLAKLARIGLKDISNHPLIVPVIGAQTRSAIDQRFTEEALQYQVAMELTSHEAVKAYVAMGLGISILSECYLNKTDKKNLFVKDVSQYFGSSERGIVTRKNRVVPQVVDEFKRLLSKTKAS